MATCSMIAALAAALPASASIRAPGDQVWARTYGNGASWNLAVAPNGKTVYVTGTSNGMFATVAYDAATGTQAWAALTTAGIGADPGAIEVSPDGSTVFVAGTVETRRDTAITQRITNTALTVAYQASTGQQLWSATYDNPDSLYDYAQGIAVTADGQYVALASGSAGPDGIALGTTLYSAASGAQVWTKSYVDQHRRYRQPASIVVTSSGAIVITGQEAPLNKPRSAILTLAYDVSSGDQLWIQKYQGARAKGNYGSQVVAAPDGSAVYVTGSSSTTKSEAMTTLAYDARTGVQKWVTLDPIGRHGSSSGQYIAISAGGAHLAAIGSALGGPNPERARTIVYDASSGAISWRVDYYVQGDSGDFGNGVVASPDGSMVFSLVGRCPVISCDGGGRIWTVVAYSAADGSQLWTSTREPPQGGDLRAFAAGINSTHVFVTGDQSDGQGGDGFLTVAVSTT